MEITSIILCIEFVSSFADFHTYPGHSFQLINCEIESKKWKPSMEDSIPSYTKFIVCFNLSIRVCLIITNLKNAICCNLTKKIYYNNLVKFVLYSTAFTYRKVMAPLTGRILVLHLLVGLL